MNIKLLATILLILCLAGMFSGQQIFQNSQNTKDSKTSYTNMNTNLLNQNRIHSKLDPGNASNAIGSATTLDPNTELDISSFNITPNLYQAFKVDLIKGYYLNVTVFNASFVNYITHTNKSVSTYFMDIDFSIYHSDGTTIWMNVSSNNQDEIVTGIIPQTDTYFVVLYPFESELQTYGMLYSNETISVIDNSYNITYYGGTTSVIPHAGKIRIQMGDEGFSVYGNNLNLEEANSSDILSKLPTLHPSLTTWLWEHNKFGLPINDLYKIKIPKNTTADISVIYYSNGITGVTANEEILSIINYDNYVNYLQGLFVGNFKDLGTNTIIVGAGNYVYSSQITNYVSNSDSYYILSLNNSKMNFATFQYNITITFKDYVDAASRNDDYQTAYNSSNLANLTLFTDKYDPDFFYVKPASQPLRLIVDVFFDRVYGKINLFLFNKTLESFPNDDSMSLVGKSDFNDQNQQSVTYLIFNTDIIYVKVNSSVEYSNGYELKITLETIDDDYEPNNNFLTPATLNHPGIYDLYLAKSNHDFFRTFLFKDDKMNVTVTFNNATGNINLFVYNDQFGILDISAQASSSVESVAIVADKNGYYYFDVYGIPASFSQPGMDYQLNLMIEEQDDYLEQNDNLGQARPIQDGYFDLIARAGDEDWYNIYMRTGDVFTVSVEFDVLKGDIDIFLFNKPATVLYKSSQTFANNESIMFTAPTEAEYILRVALFDGLSIKYKMNVTLTDELYDIYEDNDNFDQAYVIEPISLTGVIAQGGDHDIYKITVASGYAIITELSGQSASDFVLILYSQQTVEINRSDRNLNTQYIAPVPVKTTTDFYIEVYYKNTGKTTYNLDVSLGLNSVLFPPPKLNLATNIPTFTFNLFNSTTSTTGGAVFDVGTLMVIGIVGIGGGAAAGTGGTIFAQKSNFLKKKKKL
jgi:hypothetical protein